MSTKNRSQILAAGWLATVLTAVAVMTAPAAHAAGLQSRSFRQPFPAGSEVRLANLAGRVELVPGQGNQVIVDVTVRGDAGDAAVTKKILDGMHWVKSHDRKGRPEWALSYPVKDYRGFAYPREQARDHDGEDDTPWFLRWLADQGTTTTTYLDERVHIYNERRSSAPVLFADLRITLPASANVAMRNVIGPVRGNGPLAGTLTVDTGSGKVEIAGFEGNLSVDTGSGDVVLGMARGETSVDTGSGNVVVHRLIGNGTVDTGSGDVLVENVSAGKLSVDTGSGNVIVRQGETGRLVADTGSGDIHLSGIDLEELTAETGSGNVTIQSPLVRARHISAETGSGDVTIQGGANASFDIAADLSSGDLTIGYKDAVTRKSGNKVVGAKRGDGRTAIKVETGSGNCVIRPL
jgi:DUF4097 and DUF4098 domain-containing protein YvlB